MRDPLGPGSTLQPSQMRIERRLLCCWHLWIGCIGRWQMAVTWKEDSFFFNWFAGIGQSGKDRQVNVAEERGKLIWKVLTESKYTHPRFVVATKARARRPIAETRRNRWSGRGRVCNPFIFKAFLRSMMMPHITNDQVHCQLNIFRFCKRGDTSCNLCGYFHLTWPKHFCGKVCKVATWLVCSLMKSGRSMSS